MRKVVMVLAIGASIILPQTNVWAGPHESRSHKEMMGRGSSAQEPDFGSLTAAEHLSLADQFEQKAAAQDKDIAFHESMMKKYRYKVDSSPKRRRVAQMGSHCGRIIKSLRKLKEEYKEMAQMHREMAE
ncbi:MAG: hypothetical protein H6756_02470 [Candidatus Omnitrophica bacterium]|nr:hypothetical protein [Candidatus Omnitrophota bacterium]